jgi:DNA mismatch endonuclease, patch repair protein
MVPMASTGARRGSRPPRSGWSDEHPRPDGSWASSAAIRATMRGNRRRDTRPELAVRSALHRMGLRFRVDARPDPSLRRTADIVFRPARVAVFIDGCYWHGCAQHYVVPATNEGYWTPKIAGNIARDRDTDARLAALGWAVLRHWEHEEPLAVAEAVAAAVAARRPHRGDV